MADGSNGRAGEKRLTLALDGETYSRLRMHAAETDQTHQAILERALGAALCEGRTYPMQADATPDPIVHLFETVPATRKFVGGEVFPSVSLRLDTGCPPIFYIETAGGQRVAASPARARLLAAALIAAADAIEGEQ